MTEKRFSVDDIEDMLYALGVLLDDPLSGIVLKTLQRNFFEEFKEFTLMEAFDCMVDDVNRVNKVIELHDFLVGISKEDWKALLEKMDNDGD